MSRHRNIRNLTDDDYYDYDEDDYYDEEYDDYKEHAGKLYLGSDDSNKQEINMSAVSGMARALGSAENKFNNSPCFSF